MAVPVSGVQGAEPLMGGGEKKETAAKEGEKR